MRKNRIITLLLAVVVLLCTMLTAAPKAQAAGNYTIRLTGPNGKSTIAAKPGETVTLTLSVENNPGIIGVGVNISYSEKLTATKAELSQQDMVNMLVQGNVAAQPIYSPLTNNPFTVYLPMATGTMGNKLVTYNGTISQISFKIADNAPGGDYVVTITAPQDKNLTAQTDGSGVIKPNTNEVISGITVVGCKIEVQGTPCQTQGHQYATWKDLKDGKHTSTCTVQGCGHVETVAHTYDAGKVTKKATCKETGVKTYTCTACKAQKYEDIKLTSHTYDNNCDADCNVCSATRSVTHKYKTSWSKNKKEHWHVCSVCGDKKDVTAHIPGPEATEKNAQKCTECGYTIKAALSHKCEFTDTWTTDETGHWYACSGCDEQGSYAAHNFENACDRDCSVCGYTREVAHIYAETYSGDEIYHWHACTGCGDKQEIAAHEPGAAATETTAQTCTICGHEIAPALGGVTEPTEASTEAPTEGDKYDAIIKPDIIVDIPWGIIFAVVGTGALTLVIILLVKKKRY